MVVIVFFLLVGLVALTLVGIAWLIREVLDLQARMQWVVTAVIQIAPSYVAPPPPDRKVVAASKPGTLHAPQEWERENSPNPW